MWSLRLSWVCLSTGLSTAKPCANMQTAASPGGVVVLQQGKTSGMPGCFMILWYAVHRPTPTMHSAACCLWGSRPPGPRWARWEPPWPSSRYGCSLQRNCKWLHATHSKHLNSCIGGMHATRLSSLVVGPGIAELAAEVGQGPLSDWLALQL